MDNKQRIITKLCEEKLVAVIRAEDSSQAIKIAEACLEGGITSLEITFSTPFAHKVLEQLSQRFSHSQITLGAGTVLDSETARIAILSGAEFVVSPYLNREVIRLCNRYRIPCFPGVMTVKEAGEAMEAGADIVKLFPSEIYGPSMIHSLKGPLPQLNIMPTGGIDSGNIDQWLKAGAVAVGVGGSLNKLAKYGEYASITAKSRQFVECVEAYRDEVRNA